MSDDQNTLDGYTLINCIASGSDTQIWEVTDQSTSRRFAMKLMVPEAFRERERIQVLKKEGKIGKGLEHPNIITIHDIVVTKQHAYLIMDYFRSQNLKSAVHNDLFGVHLRFPKLAEQCCMALGYMHDRGWLHRDVKPDNILLNKGSEVRIIDFSLSAKPGKQKEIQGTKSYIAPETLLRKKLTPRTDIYSLGVTFFLALTGDLPITGVTPSELLKNHLRTIPPPPSQLNPNVTPEMDLVVLKMLEKKPENRFQSMDELYSSLRAIKIFKEDVSEVEARRKEEEKQKLADGVDAASRLDSRSDAMRSQLLGTATDPSRKKPAPSQPAAKPQQPAQPAAREQGGAPQPQAPQPQMPLQPLPGGYAMPQPGMPPMGMPMQPPPQYYPPQPMPQYGGMPGYGAPPMPGQPPQAPPQQPAPQQPAAAAPQQPPAPQQQPPAQQQPAAQQKPPAPEPEPAEELEFMDELPPVV